MNWRRLLSFLLAFVFIFSVLSSLSVFAYTVNGYDVVTKYYGVGDSSIYTQFNTTITSTTTDTDFYVLATVTFPEVIEEGSIVNLSFDFDHSTTQKISYTARMYNDGGSQIGIFGDYLTDKKIVVEELELEGDLSYITFTFIITNPTWNEQYTYNFVVTDLSHEVLEDDKLLGGILGWVENIFNSITNLPNNIANKLKSFFNDLKQAVIDLGNTIIDGIKNLFIPSDGDIIDFRNKMEALLYERLGGVGEAGQIVSEFVNNFLNYDGSVTGETTIPSVTVNLAGTDFTFGGYTVDFIPDKMEFLVEPLKMITNIVATFSLLVALKRKFENEVLG